MTSSAPARLWSAKPLGLADVLPDADRFWETVDRPNADQCWKWGGYVNPAGYGVFRAGYGRESRKVMAHRMSWVLENREELPSYLSIDHTCVNPPCVNPRHLEAVSIHENRRRRTSRDAPDEVEWQVQELISVAILDGRRGPRGQILRLCPICEAPYATDYLVAHIRRHVMVGPSFRKRRLRPRDGSSWDSSACPECGQILAGHLRLHRERKHGAA